MKTQLLVGKDGSKVRAVVVSHARDASFLGAVCGTDCRTPNFPIDQLTMYVDENNRSIEVTCPKCLAAVAS